MLDTDLANRTMVVTVLHVRSAMSGNIVHVMVSLKMQLRRTISTSSVSIANVVQKTHSNPRYQA